MKIAQQNICFPVKIHVLPSNSPTKNAPISIDAFTYSLQSAIHPLFFLIARSGLITVS